MGMIYHYRIFFHFNFIELYVFTNQTITRLFGRPTNLECVKESLESEFPPSKIDEHGVDIFLIQGNAAFYSYDGIRVGGLRIVNEVSCTCA